MNNNANFQLNTTLIYVTGILLTCHSIITHKLRDTRSKGMKAPQPAFNDMIHNGQRQVYCDLYDRQL